MGKPTGFLEYQREDAPAFSVSERIHHFNEFHEPLSEAEQKKQAARCMACGVPFCQSGMMIGGMISGCPLGNLIPEWNDLIYRGAWKQAWTKTISPFPRCWRFRRCTVTSWSPSAGLLWQSFWKAVNRERCITSPLCWVTGQAPLTLISHRKPFTS